MERILTGVVAAFAAVLVAGCGSDGGSGGNDTTGQPDGVNPADVADAAETTGVETSDPGADPVAADEGVVQKDNPPDPTQHEAGPDVPPPDVAPTCPVQAVTGDSCHAAAACSLLCAGDAAWEGKCTAELTADLKDGHDALVDCLAALDCQATENEVFSSCARTGCKPEIESCFAGAGKCKEIWMCRKKCSAEDPACPLRCQGIGTVAEQEAWVEYVGCVFGVECAQTQQMPNGWPIETCEGSDVHMNCAVKYQACMGL